MTLTVSHTFTSSKPVGNDSTRIYSNSWNGTSAHTVAGTADSTQLNSNVVQAVVSDTNVTGSIASQTLTLGWTGTLDATRLNANVVQAVTNDTNVIGSISAQNLTIAWSGQLGLSRGGTNANLSATGGAGQYLKQISSGAAVTVGTIPASDIASGAALTRTSDTNVTLTLGGTPATALLAATSITVGWSGTLAASRGGFGTDVSAQSGVPLFATGVPTFTSTTGSGNFARATSPTFVTPALGTPSSGTLTNCTGLPLSGLASQAANTIVGNVTGSSASPTAFTIDGLTLKGTPASTDEVIIWDVAGSAIKKATVSGIGSSSGVSSIAGNTGAFTLSNGITNSTNDIRLATISDQQILSNISGSTAVPTGNSASSVGSSLVLIQSQTASASATLDFTTGITSTYNEYLFTFTGVVPATDATNMQLLVSSDGGSTYHNSAGDYKRAINTLSDAGTNTVSGTTGETVLTLTITQSNNAGRPVGGELRVFGPSAGTLQPFNWMMSYFDGTNNKMLTGGGCYTGGVAINAIRFRFSSGNIASGTISLYGLRKS